MALLAEDDVVEEVLEVVANFSNSTNTTIASAGVQWADIQQHFVMCGATWVVFLVVGYILGSTRKFWCREGLTDTLAECRLYLNTNKYWNITNAALMAGIVILHGVSSNGGVEILDPNWIAVEIAGVVFYTLEGLLAWLQLVSAGVDGILAFFINYMSLVCLINTSVGFDLSQRLSGERANFNFGFCGFMRVAQIYNSWHMLHSRARLSAADHLLMVAVSFLSGVFAIAILLKELENVDDMPNVLNSNVPPKTEGQQAPAHERWSLFASLYFMFINTSKTGIGDVLPRTLGGQLVSFVGTSYCVYLALDVMLKALQGLELSGTSAPEYPNRPGRRHVILTGSPSFQVIKDFLSELFHEDHAEETEDLNAIILFLPGQRKTIELLSVYLSRPENIRIANRVWTVEGSALKPEDLDRCRYKTCHTAFLMPNIYSQDPEQEDVANVMRALTMKRHTSYIRIVSTVMKADSIAALLAVGVPPNHIVCYEDVTHGILGKGAEVPGFTALAASFLKTSLSLDPKDIEAAAASGEKRWLDDYALGLTSSVHEVELPDSYRGVPFSQAGVDISERSDSKAFLIGLTEEALYPSDTTNYMLFPNKYYRIGFAEDRLVKGIIIAKSSKDIKMAPRGRQIKWSHQTFIEAEHQQAQDNNPRLASSKAAVNKEGWVRDFWLEQKEKEAYVKHQLKVTAKRRAALGLAQRGKMSRVHIQEYLEEDDPEIFRINNEVEALIEDTTSELMQDPLERVLIYKQMKANNEIMEEKELVANEALADFDFGEGEGIRQAMLQITHHEETIQKNRQPDPIIQEEDSALWGAPTAPEETPWVTPKAIPDEVLLTGDHVVVLSLESDLPNVEDDVVEEDTIATGKRQPLRPGRKFPLKTFLHSLKCQRKKGVVVIVSLRVPLDWTLVQNEPGVYLVLGEPLSTVTLDRAGFYQAKSIVIYQKDVEKCSDAALVDSKAVFALRLVEALLMDAGKLNKPVLMHVHLEANTVLMPENSEPPKAKGLLEILESKNQDHDDDENSTSKNVESPQAPSLLLQHRFASGVLFSSSLITTLAANCMYSPILGSVISEMAKAAFVVIPVPNSWKGLTFGQLYDFLMRKRNLMPMALLRKLSSHNTIEFLDSALESRRAAEPDEKPSAHYDKVARLAESMRLLMDPEEQKRYEPNFYPFDRYTLVMPLGLNFVIHHDGVLCMQPTTRVTEPKAGAKRQRHDDPVDKLGGPAGEGHSNDAPSKSKS